MSVLVVFGVRIEDAEAFKVYQKAGGKSLAGRNFRMLAGPAPDAVLEGPELDEVIILEFPSMEEAREWYDSDAYQEAIKLREPASRTFSFIVEKKG